MTRDEEVIQKFEEKTDTILQKAQQYLTMALPGGPGVFAYVVVSNLVGKLFGHTRKYVERAVNRPITLPDFIYVEPLDEELEEFFDDGRLKSIRSEFPERYGDFSNNDWTTMRRYYMPLYYTLTVKEPFVSQMFSFEIQSQNYKRIIHDFDLFPLYKKTLQSIPSASKQNALWSAVTSIVKGTVNEVWNKGYALQLFEEAKTQPEVAGLIENIKVKVSEKVDLEQLSELKETIQYIAGRSISPEEQPVPTFPMKAIESIATVLPNGQLSVPGEITRKLHLRPNSTVRVLILCES
jgi:hypothetical protein